MALRNTWELAAREFDEIAFVWGTEVMNALRNGGPEADEIMARVAAFDRGSLIYNIGLTGLVDVVLVPEPRTPIKMSIRKWGGATVEAGYNIRAENIPLDAIKVKEPKLPHTDVLLLSDVWKDEPLEHPLQYAIPLNLDAATAAGHRLAITMRSPGQTAS